MERELGLRFESEGLSAKLNYDSLSLILFSSGKWMAGDFMRFEPQKNHEPISIEPG